nr:hypothetical protein [Salmonella bongori]
MVATSGLDGGDMVRQRASAGRCRDAIPATYDLRWIPFLIDIT